MFDFLGLILFLGAIFVMLTKQRKYENGMIKFFLTSLVFLVSTKSYSQRWVNGEIEDEVVEVEKRMKPLEYNHGVGLGLGVQGIKVHYSYTDDSGLLKNTNTQYEVSYSNYYDQLDSIEGRSLIESNRNMLCFSFRQMHRSGLYAGVGGGFVSNHLNYFETDQVERIYSREGSIAFVDLGWQGSSRFYVSLGMQLSEYIGYTDNTRIKGSSNFEKRFVSTGVDGEFKEVPNSFGHRNETKKFWKAMNDLNGPNPFYITIGWHI